MRYNSAICNPDKTTATATFEGTINEAGVYVRTYKATNLSTGVSDGTTFAGPLPAGTAISWHQNFDLPGTEKDDAIEFVVSYTKDGNPDFHKSVIVSCGEAQYHPYMYELDAVTAAPYLAVPNADGILPCGVFNLNGWGFKIASFVGFPAYVDYAPNLTVACFTADGVWSDTEVNDLVVTEFEANFTASQHGVCGLFPTN